MNKNTKFMFFGKTTIFAFAMAFTVAAPMFAYATYYAPINTTKTLLVGSSGSNVKALQAVLASEPSIYPSGSQDGSFGPKTKAGVIQFQLAYNLTADGIVGYNTRAKINSLASSGAGIDVSNAGIYNLSVVSSGKNEVVSFNTSEAVRAAVYYDTNPISFIGWDNPENSLVAPTITGLQNLDNNLSLNKQFTLNNTSPNTKYYYTITTTDSAGNISIIWPSTFNTNQ